MNSSTFSVCLASLFAAGLSAQAQSSSLLFTPHSLERTLSNSNGTSLRALGNKAVAFVTPQAAAPYSAELYGPSLAFQTLVGDEDADGDVSSPGLFGQIDAILVTPYDYDAERGARPRQDPIDLLDVFVSPANAVGINVSGAPGLRPGDCGRYLRNAAGNGQVDYFIRAEHLISAFGILDPVTGNPVQPASLDLDAITVSMDRDIFVSFDADYVVRLASPGGMVNFPAPDGTILCLPGSAWNPNGRGGVAAVLPNRGMLVYTEPQVVGMVINAQLTNNVGACLAAVLDTEGLALDQMGGTFQFIWFGQQFNLPHLLITCDIMTGAGVITTRNAGQIAIVNGRPLANSCGGGATNGTRMGMFATGSVSNLSALESLAKVPCWFALNSPTPNGLGGPVTVDIGTNVTSAAFLGFGLGALPISSSISVFPFAPNTLCFPEVYPTIVPNPLLAVALAGGVGTANFGSLTFPITPMVAPGILFQGVSVMGGINLSSPLTIH